MDNSTTYGKGNCQMGKDLNGKELGIGLYQRKDGRYEARYKDRNGKVKSVYGFNLREVKAERKKIEKEEMLESLNGTIATVMTLNKWTERWLSVYKNSVDEPTRMKYKRCYENHIAPALGEMPIGSISNIDIAELFNKLSNEFRKSTVSLIKVVAIRVVIKSYLHTFWDITLYSVNIASNKYCRSYLNPFFFII